MAITVEKQLIPAEHAERVILTDSFGKRHEFKVYLLNTENPDAEIQAQVALMEQQEKSFAQRARARGHSVSQLLAEEAAGPTVTLVVKKEDCGCH